jgi:hypothetical protein
MRRVVLGALLGFLLACGPRARAENYPKEVQRALGDAFGKVAAQHLEHVVERYNAGVADCLGLATAAKAAGMKDEGIRSLSNWTGFEGPLPKAQWADGQVTIKDSGVVVTISVADFMNRAMRINGKPFVWNGHASVAENLKAYDALFELVRGGAHAGWWLPDLVPSAWAQDWVAIKVAGLKLYFEVSDVGEAGGQMDRVNERVVELFRTCTSSGQTSQGKDEFVNTVMDATMRAYGDDATPTPFKNCDDVKAYANSHIQTVTDEWMNQADAPYRMPADLCKNLDRLAKCTRQLMSPRGVSSSSRKPTDPEEWHDSSAPAGKRAGAAR